MKSAEVSSNIQNFANQAVEIGGELLNKAKFFLGTTAAALTLAGGAYATESMIDAEPARGATTELVNDYPDMDAWNCSFPYGAYSWCKGIPASPISRRGYNYRNCTDWVAWREPELTRVNVPRGWGNAINWANAARVAGYTVTTKPEAGDIAHWYGNLGHVAVVENVNPNGTVNVSEYNWNGTGAYDTRNNVRADDYIDLNGVGNGITGGGGEITTNIMDRPLGVAAHQNGVQTVFWKGGDANLKEGYWGLDRAWHGPINLGMGPLGSAPTAVVRPSNNEEDVFWKGKDNNLWRAYYDGSWHGPSVLGKGPLGSQPAAAAYGSEVEVFWKGTDNNLWETWQTYPGGPWNGPIGLGMGPLGSAPTAMAHSNGEQNVFWRGTDGNLWEAYYFPWEKKWQGPLGLGMGPLGTAPTATWQPGKNEQQVFWMGQDSNLWEAYWNGCWNGPAFIGKGPLGGAPGATAWGNETDVFWPGMDKNLWETAGSTFNFGNLFGLGMGPIPTS